MKGTLAAALVSLGLALAGCSSGRTAANPEAGTSPNSAPPTAPVVEVNAPVQAAESADAQAAATASRPAAQATATLADPPPTTSAGALAGAGEWAPPPYPAPLALRPQDHFYLTRPLPSGQHNWLHPRYRYGNTHFGEEPTHTGVDMVTDRGAPVLAAGTGEVVWVGYGLYRGVQDETDPYGLAIAIEHDFGYQGQRLFTVYAHLSETYAWDGQRVEAGETIGQVGASGHASGPHLHFEVRLGENRYFATRNPELWLTPPQGWGVFAARLLHWNRRPIEEHLIQLVNLETERRWEAWTYVADTVHPDDHYNENVVIGDLPAGPYEARVNYWGRAYAAQFYVYPGQTNFVEFVGWEGFRIDPTPTAPAALPDG